MYTVYRPITMTNEPMTVNYTMSGAAVNGVDYATLSVAVRSLGHLLSATK